MLSDSTILVRFYIVLVKRKRVLSSEKLWAEATNVKYKKLLKKMLNNIGFTIDPCGSPDWKLLLILFLLS